MGVVTAAVAGGAVLAGAYMSSRAAQAGAEAQASAASEQQGLIMNQGRKGMQLAEATPQELAALDRGMTSATSQLDREERLLNAIDPAVMEASQQALKLLRGESAGITSGMSNQRTMQRQKLLNSLREQYGPGAELSSLGQKALQQFDADSDNLFQTNQANALNQVFGIATSDVGARTRAARTGVAEAGRGYSAIQDRKLNASNAMLGALSGTAGMMVNSAGAGYVGQQLMGQGIASAGQGVLTGSLQNMFAAKGGTT